MDIFKKRRDFILYAIIGVIATLVDIIFLYFFVEYLHIWYIYSAVLSFLVASIVNFSLNKYFNFRNKSKKVLFQFLIFLVVATSGVLINISIMYILVEFFIVWYIYSKLIATMFVFIMNYFGNKHLTFKILN